MEEAGRTQSWQDTVETLSNNRCYFSNLRATHSEDLWKYGKVESEVQSSYHHITTRKDFKPPNPQADDMCMVLMLYSIHNYYGVWYVILYRSIYDNVCHVTLSARLLAYCALQYNTWKILFISVKLLMFYFLNCIREVLC